MTATFKSTLRGKQIATLTDAIATLNQLLLLTPDLHHEEQDKWSDAADALALAVNQLRNRAFVEQYETR